MSEQRFVGNADRKRVMWKRTAWIAGGLTILTLCVVARVVWGPGAAEAGGPFVTAQGAAKQGAKIEAQTVEKPQVMATVNGENITRNDLAREALRHYGKEVLESLMNKHLIAGACAQKQITITTEEVAAEIDRMAQRFGVATDQWLKMLSEERHITPAQYAKDIIWPTIALRKLAADRCEPTDLEVQQAYESQYGATVRIRLIACNKLDKAQHVRALAVQKPEDFPELAKQYSDDTNSAAAKGLVPPVRRHLGDPGIERVAFAMRPQEISEPIAVGTQFVVIKCESHTAAIKVPWDEVAKTLKEACRDKKLRQTAAQLFDELQNSAQIENIFNDPVKSKTQPGVAATINGRKVSVIEVADECIDRHGLEILDGTINRRLIEQAVRKQNITVTEQDVEAEIVRAALSMSMTKEDGTVDLEKWYKHVTEEQGVPVERYRHDIVWPSMALKKLVGERVEVTAEDIQRGFEANYGERVRCRAIVFNNQRKAIEVYEMIRNKPTVENFADLAESYSVEGSSRALRGEIPPIHKYSTQPVMERAAFALKAGDYSDLFQVDDKWVVLFCEGRTKANNVPLAEVESLIREDVHEKKLRVAMAREFQRLQDAAQVDNFLAGTTKAPKGKEPDAVSMRPTETK